MKYRKVKAFIGALAVAAAMTFTACGSGQNSSTQITVEGTQGNASLTTEASSETSASTSTEAAAVEEPGTTDETAQTENASTEITATVGTTSSQSQTTGTESNTANNTAGSETGTAQGSTTGTVSSSSAAGTSGTVSQTVNLRSTSNSDTIIGAVYPGETVTITGESGDYYAVSVSGQTGLIAKQYFTTGTVSASGTASGSTSGTNTSGTNTSGTNASGTNTSGTNTSGTAAGTMTTTDDVKLRSSGDYSIITTIPAGTAVTVTGDAGNGWYSVTYNGQTGVVSSVYLR